MEKNTLDLTSRRLEGIIASDHGNACRVVRIWRPFEASLLAFRMKSDTRAVINWIGRYVHSLHQQNLDFQMHIFPARSIAPIRSTHFE